MFFHVADIRGDHDRVERRYAPSAFDVPTQPYRVIDLVLLDFDMTKDDRRVHLVGRLRTALELACGRCVEPFRLPVDVAFDLDYRPRTENTGEGERELEEDDLNTAYYDGDVIDLRQLMTEQFHLALPMKPLCRENCLGLCARCGANLNAEICSCASGRTDSRWATLQSWAGRRDDAPAEPKDSE